MVSFLLLPEAMIVTPLGPSALPSVRSGNRPAGEFVLAHLRFAHGLEEKLQVPGDSGQGAEEIVPQHRDALSPVPARLARMAAGFTFRRGPRGPRVGAKARPGGPLRRGPWRNRR